MQGQGLVALSLHRSPQQQHSWRQYMPVLCSIPVHQLWGPQRVDDQVVTRGVLPEQTSCHFTFGVQLIEEARTTEV